MKNCLRLKIEIIEFFLLLCIDFLHSEQKSPKFSAAAEADADSEVSQINTQNVAESAGMRESRGLTASAVSRL